MVDPRLKSLLKVYERKNFTKAAEELALTQPAVSKHISQLEEELGTKLFVRTGGPLQVTDEGKIAVKYARRMLQLEHNMRKELRNEQSQKRSLSIGITHTNESNGITEALAAYAIAHQNVKIKLVSDTMEHLCSMLKDWKLDMAIFEGRVSDSALRCILLDTDCLMLAVSPDHPLAGRDSVTIDEIKKEKLILRNRNSGTRNMFVSSLEARNIHMNEFTVLMEIDNIATIKDLVRRKFGVSVLARSTCLDEWHKNKIALLPIEGLTMMREINLVHHRDYEHPELLKAIVDSYHETKEN